MTPPVPLSGPEDPESALAAVVALRRLANQLEVLAVVEAIGQGWTWAQVGDALGVSAQAAHRKLASEVRARRGNWSGGTVDGAPHRPPGAQQAFREAVALSKAAGAELRGAHVLAAVCDLEQGTAARGRVPGRTPSPSGPAVPG